MKISIVENEQIEQTEVVIHCKKINQEVLNIKKTLLVFNPSIIGKKDDRYYTLFINDIYYFDSIDQNVYCYTKDDEFLVSFKLYQIEEMLNAHGFIRINKSTIVNRFKIKSFQSRLNGRMELHLISEDRLLISRNYVSKLKDLLGGKKQ